MEEINIEGINDEVLFNADFRARLRVLQDQWADNQISTDEFLTKRRELEDEYKKELTTTDQSNN